MSNPAPYEDQTYGSGRDLDAQAGRLAGHMKAEPVFLRPTTAEFWVLMLCTLGVTLLLLVGWGLLVGPDPTMLWLGAGAIMLIALAGSYLVDGLTRYFRLNRSRPQPGGVQWRPRA